MGQTTAMKQTLEFRLGQQLAMTPRMRQAIRLLQLSTLELRGELGQLAESNYMLETDDESPRAEWRGEVVRGREARDTDSLPKPEESLRDRLYWQLNAARFTDEDHLIATVIIDSIDESGYLASDLERAGFRIARRTVAKYRESMGIPPSNERRRTGAGAVNVNVNA